MDRVAAAQPNVLDQNCESRRALERIANKWTCLIVYALLDGPRRHGELKRMIEGISQKMLTQTLRSLEADGLVEPYRDRRDPTPCRIRPDPARARRCRIRSSRYADGRWTTSRRCRPLAKPTRATRLSRRGTPRPSSAPPRSATSNQLSDWARAPAREHRARNTVAVAGVIGGVASGLHLGKVVDCPRRISNDSRQRGVRLKSTCGGMTSMTTRVARAAASRLRRVWVSIFCEIPPIIRFSSPWRRGPSSRA